MIRALYSLLLWLAQPFLQRKLARRGIAEPGYLLARGERLGHYSQPAQSGAVWIHAVSLGETRAAGVLMAHLRMARPGLRFLLTHGTATGRAEGAGLLQPGDVQVWQPWDTQGATARFLQHFQPCVGLLMETEVWPNLCAAAQQRGLPVLLANGRLSEQSLAKAQRLAWLARPAYASLAAIYAQTAADAARFAALGGVVKGVLGNLKFDATPDAAQLQTGRAWAAQWQQAGGKPVLLLASSREGEEKLLIEQIKALAGQPDAGDASESIASAEHQQLAVQWLVVPRHPQRFDEVAGLLEGGGLRVSRRSQWGDGPPADGSASVWLGDSLGEMALYYGLAQAALLGGSFAPLGGQNLIEAAACGCPLIMGPHTFNFELAAQEALAAGAAQRSATLAQGVAAAQALLRDEAMRARMAASAGAFAAAHRGAAEKTAAAVLAFLPQ